MPSKSQQSVKIDTSGMKDIYKMLKKMPRTAMKKSVVERAMRMEGRKVVKAQKANMPKGPKRKIGSKTVPGGELKKSVGINPLDKNLRSKYFGIIIRARRKLSKGLVGYRAAFVEYGTKNYPAQSPMSDGFNSKMPGFVDGFSLSIANAMHKYMQRTIKRAKMKGKI